MLSDLPVEILQQVVSHLPTASSIVNLSLANKAFYKKISADDYAIFRLFVQNAFPSLTPPPLWREVACVLTSRSRAWDRRALIARECWSPCPPADHVGRLLGRQPSFGYVPIIDSYLTWSGRRWSDSKEVLAWSHFGRLTTRVTEDRQVNWNTWRSEDDHLPENDILDMRILRPHQNTNLHGESFILRKANRDIIKLEARPGHDVFEQVSQYTTPTDHVDCMDITSKTSPVLAVCNTKSISLYPVSSDSPTIQPTDTCNLEQPYVLQHRKRCAKFLTDTTLAVAVQFIQGRERSPIHIYDVSPNGLTPTTLTAATSLGASSTDKPIGRHCANTIATLDAISSLAGRPGQVFLSGWSDGIARLHDLRDPSTSRAEYVDVVDDGQILSLLPIGHERFLAGSHQNACLKVFDLRMTGGRVYDYLKAPPPRSQPRPQPRASQPQRDINIFLALHLPRSHTAWSPLPTPTDPSRSTTILPRYRGSIYSLSSPHPCSPTFYAGIENHVIALSTVSSDDVLSLSSFSTFLPSNKTKSKFIPPAVGTGGVLNLSAYERPRASHASTDAVLLRKQLDWADIAGAKGPLPSGEDSWDARWRMATYERPGPPERRGRGRWNRAP